MVLLFHIFMRFVKILRQQSKENADILSINLYYFKYGHPLTVICHQFDSLLFHCFHYFPLLSLSSFYIFKYTFYQYLRKASPGKQYVLLPIKKCVLYFYQSFMNTKNPPHRIAVERGKLKCYLAGTSITCFAEIII